MVGSFAGCCARRERPRNHRATDETDKFTPRHAFPRRIVGWSIIAVMSRYFIATIGASMICKRLA
jgi:hypothetical protein